MDVFLAGENELSRSQRNGWNPNVLETSPVIVRMSTDTIPTSRKNCACYHTIEFVHTLFACRTMQNDLVASGESD